MREILAREGQELAIGKRGENLAVCVVFDVSAWEKTYGEGRAFLVHQRNGDRVPYPCVVRVEDGKLYWIITNTDTSVAGGGHVELQYVVDETLVKSVTYQTRVALAMGVATDTPPEPAVSWLDTMVKLADEVEENAEEVAQNVIKAQESEMAAKASAESAGASAAAASEANRQAQIAVKKCNAAVGGDFLATEIYDPQHHETDVFQYVDDMISSVAGPTVFVEIDKHNVDIDAHQDIREAINYVASDSDIDCGTF